VNTRLSVPYSPELARVLSLPRRIWEPEADWIAQQTTAALRRETGTMLLRAIQAVALKEAYEQQGFFGPIGVGHGKTLVFLLLAFVLGAQRPLGVVPAGLLEKTKRDWQALSAHWKIPNWLTLRSYEVISRVPAKDWLDQFQPDLIVFDEVQKLKNRKAAVTRRFERHIKARREREAELGIQFGDPRRLKVCAMSGTITSKSPKDYAHIVQWCLPHLSPVPGTWVELEDWHLALGDLANAASRIDPGALLRFCDERENDARDATEAARRGYARRLRETPGIVGTAEGLLGTSLTIKAIEAWPCPAIEDAFEKLRGNPAKTEAGLEGYRGWELPDGWQLIDGAAVWSAARQLALGFFYVWDPRPPAEWMLARSCWASFVRWVIKSTANSAEPFDSEQDVAMNAARWTTTVDEVLDMKQLPPHEDPEIGARHVYEHWCIERDKPQEDGRPYKPNKKTIWISQEPIKQCLAWMKEHPKGIVWVEHTEFGLELERQARAMVGTGAVALPNTAFYWEEGYNAQGQYIEDATGPIIASFKANYTGRNLQYKWCDNLYTACFSDGEAAEQGIARTHRPNQPEDTVTVDVLLGCLENANSFFKAKRRAEYMQASTTNPQKLCYADNLFPRPDEIAMREGARWQKKDAPA
jgi:hypothetical protein